MMHDPEQLAREFFRRVWAPPHDLAAIDDLMTPDYRITTAGEVIEGRKAFKAWVKAMQELVREATNEHLEIITNAAGDRVVSRWVTRGYNNGLFGLPPDQRRIAFSGIAIWRVENGRLAECWVERSALELVNHLKQEQGSVSPTWQVGQGAGSSTACPANLERCRQARSVGTTPRPT